MITSGLNKLTVLSSYRKLVTSVKENVHNPDLPLIENAFKFAAHAHRKQKRLSGEPYIVHPLHVARILAAHGLDTSTLAAALLHDVVEDTTFGEDSIKKEFGEEINSLVKAVTKISTVKKQSKVKNSEEIKTAKEKEAAENIRMMLLATAQDVRVILIKLADKLHNMRTLGHQKPEKVGRIANEVLTIYAPIAGRLGMYRIKSELEDLAFRSLKPAESKSVTESVYHSRSELEKFVTTISKILTQRLSEIQIKARVEGRVKHAYSLYQKMINTGKEIHEIFDLRGVRIIVDEIRDCYGTLGIVHTLWPPIQGRFKDYIATPKVNGYQSLHTTVVGPDGRPLEIQIRTDAMDDLAEHGIAAHWFYKTDLDRAKPNASKLSWLNRLSSLTEGTGGEAAEATEFIEDLRHELSPEEVYVFTPEGDIIDLPLGSTVLDFAFRIHTDIGLRCRGANVNERMVPLRTVVRSGDRVEILTDKHPNPSPNWLRYIHLPRTKQKLRHYFRKKREDEEALTEVKKKEPSRETAEAAPAAGSETVNDKLKNVQELRIRRRKTQDPKRVPIEVAGAKDIPVRYAGCCSPVPGDRIVGYVTRGRGVTVHRADCHYLPSEEEDTNRIITVGWEGLTEKYPVYIEVKASDRQGLYLDLVGGIAKTFTNILKAEADIPRNSEDFMRARFLIEVEHVDHLHDIMDVLQSVPGVLSVERVLEKNKTSEE